MKSDNYRTKETTSIQKGKKLSDTEQAGPQTHMGWIKIQEEYLGSEESQTHIRPLAQDSSARKISLYNFWLHKPAGLESVEKKLCNSLAIPLKCLHQS